jgi:uncharacterized protein
MDFITVFSFSQWLMILLASFIIGMSKAGLKGVDMLSVTLMAFVFGSKSSTGIVLPLLCLADIAAVSYYNRHAQWNHFWKIVPWMIVGILLGVYLGKDMDETVFRKIMAVIIMITIVIKYLVTQCLLHPLDWLRDSQPCWEIWQVLFPISIF